MRVLLAIGLPLVLVTPSQAQLVTEMTPERIREAIDAVATDPNLPGRYRICADICGKGLTVNLMTPFLRVFLSAWEAQKKYIPFAEKDVAPAMLEPTMDVTIDAYMEGESIRSRVVNIEHVVSVRPDANDDVDPSTVIQPTTIKPKPNVWTSGMGVKREGQGVAATFPISVLEPGREFRVIMTGGAELAFPLDGTFLAKLR